MKKILILLSILLLSVSFLFVSCDNNSNDVPQENPEAAGKEVTQDVFDDVLKKNNSIAAPVSELAPQVMNIIQNAKELTFTAKISAKENSTFSFTTADDYTKYKEYLKTIPDDEIEKPAEKSLTPGAYEYIEIEYKILVQGEDEDTYTIKYKEKNGNEETVGINDDPTSKHLITDIDCLNYSVTVNEKNYSCMDCSALLSKMITVADATSDISGSIEVTTDDKESYSLSFKNIVTGSDKKLTFRCNGKAEVNSKKVGSGTCTIELTISDNLYIVEAENQGFMLGSFSVAVKDIDIKDTEDKSLLTGSLDVEGSVDENSNFFLKLGVDLNGSENSIISGNMVLKGNIGESSLYFELNDLNITEGDVVITGNLACDMNTSSKEYGFACSLSEKVGDTEYMAVELALDYSSDMKESILDAVKIYKLVINGENYSAQSLRAMIKQLLDSPKVV